MKKARFLTKIDHFIKKRSTDQVDSVRLVVFGASIVLDIIAVAMFFTMGNPWTILTVLTWALLVAMLVPVTLYLMGKVNIVQALAILGVSTQLVQSVRMVAVTVIHVPDVDMAVTAIELTCYTILMLMAFVPRMPLVVTLMSLASLFFAGYYQGGVISYKLTWAFTVAEVVICLMAHLSMRSIRLIQREKAKYQSTVESMMTAYGMDYEELIAFLELCRNGEADKNRISHLFDILDDRAENNLMRAARHREDERKAQNQLFEERFPQLSAVELDVCRMVATGKTVKEIAKATGKTESNVSTVRGNIRKKLGLGRDVELKEYLLMEE